MGEVTRRREETAPENAQFSTGPKTDEGKAISSQNAVTHGMRAKRVVLLSEDAEEFEGLRSALVEEYAPATRREKALVEAIAGWMWKQARMDRIETEFWERGYVPDADGKVSETPLADMLCLHGKEFSLILRYSTQASRGIEKAEKELRALQEQRRVAAVTARMNQMAAERAAAADSSAATPLASGENGRAGEGVERVMQRALAAAAAAGIQLNGGGAAAGGAAGAGQKATPLVVAPAQPARRQSQFIPGRR